MTEPPHQEGPVMLTLPDAIISVLQPFSTLFRDRTWSKAQLLLVGAILAPRKRTVTSALRVNGGEIMCLSQKGAAFRGYGVAT